MLQQFSAPSRRIAVWIVAGVIVVLLAALWYLPNRKPAADKVAAHKPVPKVFRQKISQDRRPAETVIRKKVTAAPAEIKTPQPPAETSTQPPPAETSTQPPPAETPTGPQPAVTSTQPQPIEASTQPPANIKTKQPAKAETALAETAAAVPIKKESPQKTTVQPAPAPSIAGAPETAGTKTDLRAARREKWLLSQDATAYTIQIMGVHDEQFLLDFIKKYQLLKDSEIAYYESTYQGKAWFQLLYGIYPARQEAELAADKLPENIRRAGPWVRRLSTIQKAIRNRGIQ